VPTGLRAHPPPGPPPLHRRRAPRYGSIYSKTLRTKFFRRRSIMWTFVARPCRSSGCDNPPACVASRLTPKGDSTLTWLVDFHERHALRLLPGCPPPTPMPAAKSAARTLLAAKIYAANICLARGQECIWGVTSLEKKSRTSRAGDLGAGVHIVF
jgi:hypothetical protein